MSGCFQGDRRRAIPKLAGDSILLGATLALGLLLGGCRSASDPAPDLVMTCEIAPQPPRTGPATVTLRLSDKAGRPVSGVQARLEANMSHAGMRPVFGEAKEVEPGRYQGLLEFTMGGDWVILVHLLLPDGRRLEREIPVAGVEGAKGGARG